MPEEIPQLPVSEQEIQIKASVSPSEASSGGGSFREKIKAQKKKILIGLGIFLGILVISGTVLGIYLISQRQAHPEPVEGPTPEVATPSPDPTADWETYTNTEYNYSIKYPQDVTAETDEAQNLVSFEFPEQGKWTADLSIKHYQNPESLDPQTFYQKSFNEAKVEAEKKSWPLPPEPLKSETIKIGNLEGFQIRISAYEACQRVTYLGQGETMVVISFYDENPNDPAQEEHLIVFDLILSTFKFLEEENFEDRKTSLLNVINTYLEALIIDKDWEKAKNYLSASAYEQYKDVEGPSQYVSYEILNEHHSVEEEISFYNQTEPTFEIKFYKENDPTGTPVSIKFFQENREWKTGTWFGSE